MLRIFGYGSLIMEPESAPDASSYESAELSGYRRHFNKRSPRRGSPISDAYDAFENPDGGCWHRAGHNDALALGTVADPAACITGVIHSYPAALTPTVLAATDRREGYNSNLKLAELGYLRVMCEVTRPHRRDTVKAYVYLSNPGGEYHVNDRITTEDRARILINATPRPGTQTAADGRARGIYYLEAIRRALFQLGTIDPMLEKMAAAILALDGPWCAAVTPSRLS
jgi:cation transport regulator ChaC